MTRHGQRADDKTQTSISLRKELLKAARQKAEADNRSFSNWVEQIILEKLGEEPTKSPTKNRTEEEPRSKKSKKPRGKAG